MTREDIGGAAFVLLAAAAITFVWLVTINLL